MAEHIVLSISLLASNRPVTIRKCLDSLKPIMEQIPSELILVDTSGSESLHQILLEYTDQVIPFTWCNDFSKARNIGLKRAKGEWFLFLDDDEWFEEIDPLVRFFKSGEYQSYTCANYIVRNFYDRAYQNYSDSWVSRMVRLDPVTEFRSKIHEYLYPAGTKCKSIPAVAYHSGYIYDTEEDRRKHFERNASLLLNMIEEEPDNLRWKVQLAQEYRSIKDWEKLAEYCDRCLEETRSLNNKYDNYDIGTFYAGKMESLLFLKCYDKAIQVGNEAMSDPRNSLLCEAYIDLCYATLYFRAGDDAKAEDYAHRYLRTGRRLRKDPVGLEDQKTALLVGEALDSVPMKRVYSILIACGIHKGDLKPLRKYLKNLEWNRKVIYVFDGMVDVIVDAAARFGPEEILVEASQYLWDNADAQRKYFVQTQAWADKPDEFQKLLSAIARIRSEHWYVYYARVRVADMENHAESIAEELKAFYQHCNVFMTPGEILEIAGKYQVDVEDLYLSVAFDRWKEHIEEYIGKVTLDDLLITEEEFKTRKTKESPYYDFLFLRIAEAKVVSLGTQQEMTVKREWLMQFEQAARVYRQKYYQKSVLSDYTEILPEDLQASIYISRGLGEEDKDQREALKAYKMAMELCPSFAEALKNYVHSLQEDIRQKKQRQKEEMRALQQQIKVEAGKAIDAGKPADAYEILTELKKMQPDDLETAELILKARLAMLG